MVTPPRQIQTKTRIIGLDLSSGNKIPSGQKRKRKPSQRVLYMDDGAGTQSAETQHFDPDDDTDSESSDCLGLEYL
jgi:hypothetical protein